MLVEISLTGDKALIARLEKMPGAVRQALELKVTVLALKLEKLIKTGKLNGQVLNRISGRLARSINNKVEVTANSVFAKVFSAGDVKYAAIHEYGGQTAPHIIEPKKASVLAFAGAGGMVFAKRVNHPGSKMPQRSFMRSALKDMSVEISTGMKKAVVDAANKSVHGK